MTNQIPRSYTIALLLAAFLNISPALLRHVGADILVYLVWMRCFVEQFWQGDLYPRWCFDVNAGLGTSVFVFYFPLSFYIAAIFYPLVQLGLSYYGLFIFLCFLSSVFAAFTCFSWLRDIVKPPYALIASILFLFLPYHLEMMFFRGAYSELWVLGLMPLLFKYTRRMSQGQGGIVKLATTIAALLLTHIPVTAEALVFSGVYLLAMSGKAIKPKRDFALSVLWGAACAAFYVIPAMYYHQFLAGSTLASGLYGWPNNFLTFGMMKIQGLDRPLMAAGLGMLVLIGISANVLFKRKRIEDLYIQRETTVWIAIAFAALFLLFPISSFIYALAGPVGKIFFPWRMQMLVLLATTYLLAVWMQWQISPGKRKTWKTDFAITLAFLWIVSNILVSTFSAKGDALNEQIENAKIVFAPEYRSQWTDEANWEYEFLLTRLKRDIPKAQFTSGEGDIKIERWSWSGLSLDVNTHKPATLRLNHDYFPVWHAKLYRGNIASAENLKLYPEEHTGLMLLDIPHGRHLVTISYDIARENTLLMLSQWISVIAFFSLLVLLLRPKLFDNPKGR